MRQTATMKTVRDANARLIAAAPRMLEIIRALAEDGLWYPWNPQSSRLRSHDNHNATIRQEARALLREIEGER